MTALAWVNGKRVEIPPVQSVTRRQARIALGPEICAMLDEYAANPENPWPLRVAILDTSEWYRGAPEIDELAWLVGMDAEAIDALFTRAALL